jgi:hypothetical protein
MKARSDKRIELLCCGRRNHQTQEFGAPRKRTRDRRLNTFSLVKRIKQIEAEAFVTKCRVNTCSGLIRDARWNRNERNPFEESEARRAWLVIHTQKIRKKKKIWK